jgi:hypothetical protein
MTLEEINLAFRMIAQGRPHQEAAQKLAEALQVVLATPEERLALCVKDSIELPVVSLPLEVQTAVESSQTAEAPAPDKPRRGRPPKQR